MSLTIAQTFDGSRRLAYAAAFGVMRPNHTPATGLKYWTALCVASVLGCNGGDLFASAFGLLSGFPLLAVGFAATLFAERRSTRPTKAYYWTAILLVRVAATNLADFLGHQFGIAVALGGMAAALGATQLFGRNAKNLASGFPTVDAQYWTRTLIAGTLGTALGDFSSFMSGLGQTPATLALSGLFAALIAARSAGLFASMLGYWAIVVTIRTADTAFGVLSAAHIGLPQSAVVWALALLAILFFRTKPSSAAAQS